MSVITSFGLNITSGDGVAGNSNLQKAVSGLTFTGISSYLLEPQLIGVAPPAAPACTPGTGGSMSAGDYLVKITYVNAPQGESLPSAESSSQTVGSSGTLTVTSPSASAPAKAYNVYITAANGSTGTETQQNTNPIPIGTNYVQSAAVSPGAALPGTNTTLTFAPTLPVTPVQALYLRNTSASTQVASVSWTKQGGTSEPVLDLVPSAPVLFLEQTAGTNQGGVTALSITVSAVQGQVEGFFAG